MIKDAKILSVETSNKDYRSYGLEPRGDVGRVMSRSDLMEFSRCPSRWLKGYKAKSKEAMDYGSMIDTYILDNKNFDNLYTVTPPVYFNEKEDKDKPWNWNANFCKEWKKQRLSEGKLFIKLEDREGCGVASVELKKDRIIDDILTRSDKQVMVVANWVGNGIIVPIKALIDIVPEAGSQFEHYLCDLKTCRSASNDTWPKDVYNYGYHVQAAFYIDMYHAATKEPRDGFVHIVQESYEPYEAGRKYITEEFIEEGRKVYEVAISKYCECLKSKKWPGYDDDKSKSIDGFTITEPEAWMIK